MSELSEAINEMRNMRESYDQLGAAAEAYNTGKTELAANITAKGVPASATETLPELAEKVSAIAQESYTINGGEMYAKQLFGSLETPNYWNLYEVLANLLSDGRLVSYGGILLAEYYRGYDSLALAGAGAGGAYVVSDLDENGQFKMYTEDTTHVWDTAFDGKGNRWVAYCFADEYHDFQITNTNTSPRSIFIGRKVGTIMGLVNSRVSQIVVPDGNKLYSFDENSFQNNFGKEINVRNTEYVKSIVINDVTEKLFLDLGNIADSNMILNTLDNKSLNIILKAHNVFNGDATRTMLIQSNKLINIPILYASAPAMDFQYKNLLSLYTGSQCGLAILSANSIRHSFVGGKDGVIFYGVTIDKLVLDVEDIVADLFWYGGTNYLYIGYKENIKTNQVNIGVLSNNVTKPSVIELKDGICKNIILQRESDRDILSNVSEENICTYMLRRLKQDEPDCGDGVTITLGQTNLNKLTSEESLALLDELANTYGYTFA